MAKKSFSISAAVSYGFKTAKKNLGFLIVVLLISFAVSAVPGLFAAFFASGKNNLMVFIVRLVGWVLQMVVALGMINVALRIYDRKKAAYSNLFDNVNLVIPYFFASILYGLIVVGGLILLVVPGIVWAIKFRYFSYFMVDKGLGPIDALKASGKITDGVKWQLFLFGLTLLLVNIVGLLCLVVGLVFTAILSMMAEAYVFRKLQGK